MEMFDCCGVMMVEYCDGEYACTICGKHYDISELDEDTDRD